MSPKVTLPQFSIATKLYAIFALLATVTVAIAAAAVVNARLHQAMTNELDAAQAGAQNVDRANGLIYAVTMEARGIYLAPDAAAVAPLAESLMAMTDRIGGVVAAWRVRLGAEDSAQFTEFASRAAQFQIFAREFARIATTDGPQAARAYAETSRYRDMRRSLNDDLTVLSQLYAHRATQLHGIIDRHIDWTAWFTTALAGIAVLLAAAGAFIIWRAVARPLARITEVTEAVAAGAQQRAVPYRERNDEIGGLARSIAVFQTAMQRNDELSRTVVENAKARERRQEQIATEIENFSADIEATLAKLAHLAGQMLSASTQLTGAADHASERTARASESSTEASANVRDIASAADELAASVAEIDRQVAQSNMIATRAVSETEQTNLTVAELNQAAGRIGDVVRLITDIAEQTNLLALNATIEAARAGEAGRGFAVVAGEVKALAGQTARATQDISTQIAAMQHATVRSIDAIGAIERTIRSLGEISSAIAAAVTEQGAATQEIARSVETAARRTSETAGEVACVGQATAATRENATAVEAVAGDLGAVAQRLRRQVDQFFAKLNAA
ncbi:MAG: HAMP domain-containing protein [Hyphomicrobiales bacterium]|nr:HAMP domain-containing protein [Hyphomicrobiales bacterium]